MREVTLDLYKAEERRRAMTDARKGLLIHGAVSVVVCLGLVLVNIFVASASTNLAARNWLTFSRTQNCSWVVLEMHSIVPSSVTRKSCCPIICGAWWMGVPAAYSHSKLPLSESIE